MLLKIHIPKQMWNDKVIRHSLVCVFSGITSILSRILMSISLLPKMFLRCILKEERQISNSSGKE